MCFLIYAFDNTAIKIIVTLRENAGSIKIS